MGLPDATISISDGGGAGGAAGGGAAPGFVATPSFPVMTLSGPAGLTSLTADALGVPNFSVNGSPPAPIGATLIAPFSGRRVVSAGVMEVAGVRIRARLVEWKRADLADMTMTGTWPTVGAWADKSGNGNNETATGTPQWVRNAVNGRPGVLPASGSYFSSSAANLIGSGAQRTCIVVCKPTTVGGRLRVFRRSGQVFICEYLLSAGNTYVYGDGVSTNGLLADNPAIAGVPVVLQFSYDASAAGADAFVRLRINGVDHGIVNGQIVSDTGTQGWSTGSLISDQANNFDGPICEILTLDGILSWQEQEALDRDLGTYYGLTVAAPTQAMPFGDSTTKGLGASDTLAAGGWRKYVSAAKPSLQFVGGVYSPHSTFGESDGGSKWKRCEAHPGFTTGPIVPPGAGQGLGGPQLAAYLTSQGTRPRLIMFQGGQNDAGLGTYTAAQTAANISDFCDEAYAIDRTIQIVIMRANKQRSNQSANNAVIVAQGPLIAAAVASKPNVLGFFTPTDLADNLYNDDDHPTDAGYQVRAADWIAALTAVGY